MKDLTNTDRIVFVVRSDDSRKVSEAKFKLADKPFSYGRLRDHHYWSFPPPYERQVYDLLKSLFSRVILI
jgi:hypothetical protein